MSDNEFDAERDRAEEAPDNLVLTGEEIELPGEDSDASAIIGESSEPIHTGEIEAVAIGGLTGRVPAAAPLKPTIEDKISTGELPVVSAPEGDLPVVSSSEDADAGAAEATEEPEATEDAPSHEAPVEEATEDQAPAVDATSDEPAPASSNEEGEQPETSSHQAEDAENSFASLLSSAEDATADEVAEDVTEETEPALAPVMTPAQAAAALSEANDEATDEASDEAEAPSREDEPSEGEVAAVGGAAAEASTHSPSSRRSMIFGDDETLSPSIPAVAAQENAPAETSAEEATPFTEPTAQLPTQEARASYSFADQDAAEETRPRRRSLLGEGNADAEAATLAAIASTASRGDKSDSGRLDDELFSAAPQVTEMPSRTGAHWLSFLFFLLLVPVGWYLAADGGARMTLADAAPMYTGVASMLALGELLGSHAEARNVR